MRLGRLSGLVVGILSASIAVVSAADTESNTFPEPELVEDTANLELRQNLGVAPTATLASGQIPPVTIYTINSQVGLTAAPHVITFTQTFATPIDQWPSAKPGVIGLGKRKRDAEPAPTPQAVNHGIAGRIRT